MRISISSMLKTSVASVLLTLSLAQASAAAPVGASAAQLHPMKTTLPPNISMNLMAHEGLFRFDGQNKVVPELASEWSFSDDGLVFTVKIKTGHVFSNGNPVDAAAIVSSLNRLKDPSSGSIYTGLYSVLGEISAPTEDIVAFHLKQKNGHLLTLLANPAAAIIDTKAEDEIGAGEFARKPIGSGPYIIEEFKPNEIMSVVPNDKYQGDFPATLQRVTFMTVPEDGSRMALLETGDVDIATQVPAESMDAIKRLDFADIVLPDSMFSIGMEIRMTGPFEDNRVREALNISIDRKGMIEGILGGLASEPTTQVGPGTQDGMRREMPKFTFDPERAKALLTDAGYKDGDITLIMHCPNGRFVKDAQICQALAAQWQAIGIKSEARVYDLATWSAKNRIHFSDREDNMTMMGRATPGIDSTLYRLFFTGVTANTTGFSNPRVDELLVKGRATADPAEQQSIYGEIQEIVWNEKPFVFLYYPKQSIGVKNAVQGVIFKPEEVMHFYNTKIAD